MSGATVRANFWRCAYKLFAKTMTVLLGVCIANSFAISASYVPLSGHGVGDPEGLDATQCSIDTVPPEIIRFHRTEGAPNKKRKHAARDSTAVLIAAGWGRLYLPYIFHIDERVAQAESVILCQKQLSDQIILRRIQYTNDQCVDQQINVYSGMVVSSAPAPCDPKC